MTRFETQLSSRLRNEDGAAMIIAVIVLMITSALVAVAVSVAVQTNGSTLRDQFKKNALESAEAGLQIGLYRMNMLNPCDPNTAGCGNQNYCVGDAATAPGTSGWCQSSTYTMGNGSTYQYWTSPALGNGATCVGLPLTNSVNYIAQRCVTAVGTTNGITARSQIRVAAFRARPLFPVPGITGLKSITNLNNATINGWVASNGIITDTNGATVTGVELGPAGTFVPNAQALPPPSVLPSPIVLNPVDPGQSNQTLAANCPARLPDVDGYTSCNDDYRISNELNTPSLCGIGAGKVVCDQATGAVTFNAATRTLTMKNNSTLTLGGGIYNFCEVDIPNNATISLTPGQHVEVFVDSPDDPNSGCPTPCAANTANGNGTPNGFGNLNLSNNVTWTNLSQDPLALQLYVYGCNNGSNVVNFTNNTVFWGILYAPQSTINASNSSNNSAFWGAISGNVVNVSNNYHFNWVADSGTLSAGTTGVYYRTAWAQCTPTPPTPSSPGAGCG
jgi:Flp pilus assembly pilin Flp